MLPTAGWPALLAPAATAVALLAASEWLADSRVGYLAITLVATAAGAALLRRTAMPAMRVPLGAALAALLVFCAIGGRAQLRLAQFAADPAAVSSAAAAGQRLMLRRHVDDELAALRETTRHARALPREPAAAMHALSQALGDDARRAAVVLHGDTLVAWAGTLHADLSRLVAPSGVVATPFGLTLYVSELKDGVRTVAASLLYAAPPADRLVKGLAQRVPSDEVTEGFAFAPPGDSATPSDIRYLDGSRALFLAHALVPSAGEVRFRLIERAHARTAVVLLIAMLGFLVATARRRAGALSIVGGAIAVLATIAMVPLSEFSTRSRLFDAAVYYLPAGHAFTANAAALLLTSATVLLLVMFAARRIGPRLPRWLGAPVAIGTILAGPFAVRALSRGIAPPAEGSGSALWVIWSVPLCLAATVLLVLASWAGRRALGGRIAVPAWSGPGVALIAAVVAPLAWQAPGQWPQWYTLLWAVAVALVVIAQPSHRALSVCAAVAALAATTVVWGSASRGRVELAERDVRGLSGPDQYAIALQERLASSMEGDDLPMSAQALLERYVTSDLASSGYPVALISWQGSTSVAAFGTGPLDVAYDTVGIAALQAAATGKRLAVTTRAGVYGVRALAVPMRGGVVSIVVAPRTRMIATDAYARWYGLASPGSSEPLYTVQVISDSVSQRSTINWRREDTELHGDWPVLGASGPARAHVEVDLRGLDSLLPRGGLLVLADLAVVALVWLIGAVANGRVTRWLRLRRRRMSSYRARLSLALFLFFLVPAGSFAVWSWQQLSEDAQASRRLLVTETMRAFAGDATDPTSLKRESRRLDTKLLTYRGGVLAASSDSLFADFAPMGSLMRPDVALELSVAEELSATRPERLEGATGMLGYRALPGSEGQLVLAAPARVDDFLLDRRRRDLGVLVLFATALGAAAAFWLSAVAARELARPIAALRSAARAVARGERDVRLDGDAVSEFMPVFTAFRAMARDLGESRAALVEAQRRTDAVLRTVASGVVAVDEAGRVILANPRADALIGAIPPAGGALAEIRDDVIPSRVAQFLAGSTDADGFDVELRGRTLRGQLTRLSRGGAVLTLDDVTELARAQRVLAWGEMARQVAHEIKNPLTPIRLGVQHLRRARGRADFDEILEQNVSRILGEIDRLDEIARAFSRYGSAPDERPPAEPSDIVAIVNDVVALERLGEGHVRWSCRVDGSVPNALARGDELREVLLNLFENARLADATKVEATVSLHRASGVGTRVLIEVVDDGSGIDADDLPRIFEPHFSTRTSGSGLGLAITRRLVEGWGGDVAIESVRGTGTTVRVSLVPA